MAGSSSKCSLYTSVIHQSGFDCIRMIQRGQICRCEYVDLQWIILIHVIRVSLLFVFIKPDSFSVSNLTIILVYIRTLMLRSPRMKPFTIHQRYSLAFSLGLRLKLSISSQPYEPELCATSYRVCNVAQEYIYHDHEAVTVYAYISSEKQSMS